ncbi:recombinase RecT [Rummeliibacillus sp. POC4]|uniref:recombinase RecT n=1 Tax=Rummeliibacillus sp. POC4 TaxID=2305899 RepID=UPI000E65FEFA|nr:RecT family recombinase [Rummeliibacillus sp. POC4]RIJ63112.1 recombinase RecT [Rummeliibacillus sp. POC4]
MANQVAIIQKDITDSVNNKLGELQKEGLVIPPNYSASNALKSAFFKLQEVKDKSGRPALEACTKDSIANALLDMTVQGLSPAKTQCYFVVYGSKLQLSRSYFGTQTVLKRLSNVKDIWANVIYQDDEFDYENYHGRERLISHKTKFENRDKDILGAYAIVQTTDDEEILTVMTKKEIEASWSQSKTSQAVHKKFPQEMAKRTVINRAAKAFINTSDDSDLLIEAINNTTENEFESSRKDITPEQDLAEEINQNANQEMIDIPKAKVQPEPEQKPEPIEAEFTEQQDIFGEPPANMQEGPGF